MNLKLILFINVFLLMCCVGCSSNGTWGDEKWTEEAIFLEGEDVYVDQTIWNEGDLIFLDDYVIFENAHDGKLFSLYAMMNDSLKLIGDFLTRGRGPFELMDADIYYLKNDNMLMLVGYNMLGKSIAIPLHNIENVLNTETWIEIDYGRNPIRAYYMHPIKDSVFIMQIFEECNNMFAIFNVDENLSKHYLNILYPDNQSIINGIKGDAYHGWTVKHPTRNQYVYSNMNSQYVKIFTLDDNNALIDEIVVFDQIPLYDIDVTNRKVKITGHPQDGLQICVSERFIYYADPKIDLMNRQQSIARNGFLPGYFKEIYVSDWDGIPLAKYVLDRPVCYLQSDPNDKYLYAFYLQESSYEPMMVRFSRP